MRQTARSSSPKAANPVLHISVSMLQPAGIHAEDLVGYGTSGAVALYPNMNTVIKFAHSDEGEDDILGTRPRCQREKEAYERLAAPDRPTTILKYLGPSSDGRGILLEYAENGTVEKYLQRRKPLEEMSLRWSRQAAEALVFCHSRQVLHGDIRFGNLLLDQDFNSKLGNFTGSSIDQSEPLSYYDTDHLLPQDDFAISLGTEIFAFGSMLFRIVSGSRPYHSLTSNEKAQRFRLQQFPGVAGYGERSRRRRATISQNSYRTALRPMNSLANTLRFGCYSQVPAGAY